MSKIRKDPLFTSSTINYNGMISNISKNKPNLKLSSKACFHPKIYPWPKNVELMRFGYQIMGEDNLTHLLPPYLPSLRFAKK